MSLTLLEQGRIEEDVAYNTLTSKYTVDDRRGWPLDSTKPYAMDFYLPDLGLAIDFKYKKISKYNSFFLAFEHFSKYMHYFTTQSTVDKALLWYKDSVTGDQYTINLLDLQDSIYSQAVRIYSNQQYRKPWESGCFFSIPVSLFDNFTLDF